MERFVELNDDCLMSGSKLNNAVKSNVVWPQITEAFQLNPIDAAKRLLWLYKEPIKTDMEKVHKVSFSANNEFIIGVRFGTCHSSSIIAVCLEENKILYSFSVLHNFSARTNSFICFHDVSQDVFFSSNVVSFMPLTTLDVMPFHFGMLLERGQSFISNFIPAQLCENQPQ